MADVRKKGNRTVISDGSRNEEGKSRSLYRQKRKTRSGAKTIDLRKVGRTEKDR